MRKMDERSVDEVDAMNGRSWASFVLNPQSALSEAERALAIASEIGYDKGRADALLNIGWSMHYLSRLSEAFEYYHKALRLYDELDDFRGRSTCFNAFGVYNLSIFRLDKAIDYYKRSLSIAKEHGLVDRELIAMANIGEVFMELGNPKGALDYLITVYSRMPSDFDRGSVADCLRNIGEAFLRMDNLVLAAEFTKKSYDLAAGAGEPIMATNSLETLAGIAIAIGNYAEADRLAAQGLALAAQTGNTSQRASHLIVKGAVSIALGRPEAALESLSEAERLCESINLKSKLFKVHEQFSKAYEALGDHRRALSYYKLFSDFRLEVQHEDTANKLRSFQAQSEIESAQHEAEIYRLKNIDLKGKTEELEESNRRILSISNIGKLVTASLDYGTVVQTIYDCLKPFLEMDMFGIALHDEIHDQLVYKRYFEEGARKSDYRIRVDSDSSFAAWAFRNRKPVLIADKEAEYQQYLSKPSSRKGRASQSIVCLPLAIEGKAIGVMTVQNYKPRAYAEKNLSFLEALSPYVGIAIENALIHDRLEDLNRALSDEKRRLLRATLKISHLANHDTLTGLPNRRLLFELMGKAMESARRTGGKMGVVFIDLDDFKPINDRFGHAAGDSALVAMAERIRGLVRASDIVARIGGDEFVAVITNVRNRDDIEKVASKVIGECSNPLTFAGNSSALGMSMGISVFPDDGETIEDLVNKADSAMYHVKHVQKNNYSFVSDAPGVERTPPVD